MSRRRRRRRRHRTLSVRILKRLECLTLPTRWTACDLLHRQRGSSQLSERPRSNERMRVLRCRIDMTPRIEIAVTPDRASRPAFEAYYTTPESRTEHPERMLLDFE